MSKPDIIRQHTERWDTTLKEQEEQYIPEKYQLGIIADFLNQLEIQYATEQSIFSYPIDILCVNDGETIAIELKSRNTGKGIDQALRNADYVDFSFLAVWEEDISENLINRVLDLPIGLIGVGESVDLISIPDKTGQLLYSREKVIKSVKNNVREYGTV